MRPTLRRVTPNRARSRRALRGGIALMTAILLPVLLAFAALVIDVGRMYVIKTEVQNAMDGCALAASQSLTGSADPVAVFDVGRARGLTLSDPNLANPSVARDPLAVNRLHFQNDTFNQGGFAVEFSTSLSGPWIAATSTSYAGITPQTTRYVRCTYLDAGNNLLLVPMLRALVPSTLTTMTVAATAAATLSPSQSTCALPLGVCRAPTGTAANNYGLTVGQRIAVVSGGGGGTGGQYGWIDFTPGSPSNSEAAALIKGPGACNVTQNMSVTGAPGAMTSLEQAVNTRFGVYHNSESSSASPPDFTGYGYGTGSPANRFSDYETRATSRTPFQGATSGPYTKLTSAQHGNLGQLRRVVAAPIIPCPIPSGPTPFNTLDFACVLLLAPLRQGGFNPPGTTSTLDIEFLGLASTPGSPCSTSGLAGGTVGPRVPALVQ